MKQAYITPRLQVIPVCPEDLILASSSTMSLRLGDEVEDADDAR